jgi:APA family basic amino acid/polyamine antiporter
VKPRPGHHPPRRRPAAPRSVRRAASAAARYEPPEKLRRGFGSPALFAIVQCFIAASIYFGMGVVAEHAQGLTWLVYIGAALFFILLMLSYVEGVSLHQERGGATVLARYGFNELWSFVAGWAICLDYVILIAITAFAATDYAAVFWSPVALGVPQFLLGAVLVAAVAAANIAGGGRRRYDLTLFVVLADLALQVVVIVLGVAFLLDPDVLTQPQEVGRDITGSDFLFASTLAIVAFSGIDASSGLAGEVPISRRGLRRLLTMRVLALIPFVGIAIVATSALPLAELTPGSTEVEAPMRGVAEAFEQDWLREPLRYIVAASGLLILGIAANAAMLGLSRLGHSLATNRQIPLVIGRLHERFHTPWVVIATGAILAIALQIPADLEFLAGSYAFGATLAFSLVHLAILTLRRREPERDRPYKIPLNLRLGGTEWPLPAVLGFVMSALAFASVVWLHEGARIVGSLWIGIGLLLYVTYRVVTEKPVLSRVSVPEESLTRHAAPEAQYGSILVPVLGTPMDVDIMQTAGRLAAEEGLEEGEGGAVIEALWVFEVPVALPIDAPIPDSELKRARKALQRAKLVGEEYGGVEVATATTRGRRAGETIVREARRRGVEAIVLAAEKPSSIRGGELLGGKRGLRETFVGEVTRYVVQKAPCRVIITAPPRGDGSDLIAPVAPSGPAAVPPGGLPLPPPAEDPASR